MKVRRQIYLREQTGAALPVVLAFMALAMIFVGIGVQLVTQKMRVTVQQRRQMQLQYLAEAGVYGAVAIWQSEDFDKDLEDFQDHPIIPDTVFVSSQDVGLYKALQSKARLGSDSLVVRALVGQNADQLFPEALQLGGAVPVFVLAQGCQVTGPVSLAVQELQYESPQVRRSRPVRGEVRINQDFKRPQVFSQRLKALIGRLESELEGTAEKQREEIAPDEIDIFSLQTGEEFSYYVHGDLELKDTAGVVVHSPGTLVCSGNLRLGGSLTFTGYTTFIAGENIFIEDSVLIERGILYSRQGTYLGENARVRGQLFAGRQYRGRGSSRLLFPSTLVVKAGEGHVMTDPDIQFEERSVFDGLVVLYTDDEGREKSASSVIPGKVHIQSTAACSGGIYSAGAIEIMGLFDGFISTEITQQKRNYVHWTNALGNLALSRFGIQRAYPLPILFNSPGSLFVAGMRHES